VTQAFDTRVWDDKGDKIIDVSLGGMDIFSQYLPHNSIDADDVIEYVQMEARAMLVWVYRAKRERGI